MAVLVLAACVLVGCTTRQVTSSLEGSTAQRLVTFSLDKFIIDLAQEPEISALEGKTVHLGVHFLKDHQLIDYATKLLTAELQIIHDIKGELALDMGVTGAPETFLVKDGQIIAHYRGEVNDMIWGDVFTPIIKKENIFNVN